MIIDAFTHLLTEDLYEFLQRRFGFEGLSGRPSFLWDIEGRLDDMDEFGIDKHVLTVAPPSIWRDKDDVSTLELARLANDEVRGVVDRHPDRFVGIGTVPRAGEGFLEEFNRCIDDLDLAGIQVFSNVNGRPLDAPEVRPLFERAVDHGVALWIHPQSHPWYDWVAGSMDDRLFGWPFDTTLALSRLVFGGVVSEFPDLEVVTHHMGGMVSLFGHRLESFYESRKQYPETYAGTDLPDLDRPVQQYFQDFYADTVVSGSAAALACGEAFFGDDRLVFATDYPFGPDRGRRWTAGGLEAVDRLDVDADGRERVLAGNLQRLID